MKFQNLKSEKIQVKNIRSPKNVCIGKLPHENTCVGKSQYTTQFEVPARTHSLMILVSPHECLKIPTQICVKDF